MIKNRKHDHIGFPTNDIDQTVKWYIEVLGFEKIGEFETADKTRAMFIKGNDIVLEIYQPLGGVDANVAGKLDHYAFASDNIQEDYDYCVKSGYNIVTNGIESIPEFWEKGIRYFKIASPTGEEMEFCQVL